MESEAFTVDLTSDICRYATGSWTPLACALALSQTVMFKKDCGPAIDK